MVEGCFCYDGDMLTRDDNFSSLKGEMINLRGEMVKMEQRIEEKAQARHDEILDRLENVVGVTD